MHAYQNYPKFNQRQKFDNHTDEDVDGQKN